MKFSSLFLCTLFFVIFVNNSHLVNSYARLGNLVESEIDFMDEDNDKSIDKENNLYSNFLNDEHENESNIDDFIDIQEEEILEQYYLKRDSKEIKNSNSNLNKNWIESEADEVFSDSNRLLLEKLKKLGFQNDKTSNVKISEISKMLLFFLFIMNILL